MGWLRVLALLGAMGSFVFEPNTISYSITMSACAKRAEWQKTLAMLNTMRQTVIKPNLCSYNMASSACEKGAKWWRAFELLATMDEAVLEQLREANSNEFVASSGHS